MWRWSRLLRNQLWHVQKDGSNQQWRCVQRGAYQNAMIHIWFPARPWCPSSVLDWWCGLVSRQWTHKHDLCSRRTMWPAMEESVRPPALWSLHRTMKRRSASKGKPAHVHGCVKPSSFSQILVQFSSGRYLRARESPYALHPVSQKFPQRCL